MITIGIFAMLSCLGTFINAITIWSLLGETTYKDLYSVPQAALETVAGLILLLSSLHWIKWF